MSGDKDMISVRMPADLVSALRQLADQGGETFSDVMRRAALDLLGVCPTCNRPAEPETVWAAQECPACHDTYVELGQHLVENVKGCLDEVHRVSQEIVTRVQRG